MLKRRFLQLSGLLALLTGTRTAISAPDSGAAVEPLRLPPRPDTVKPVSLSKAQWQRHLTAGQFSVLREEATERPNSHPLNNEKRDGDYLCAGCGLLLFTSDMKYDSGTGWPSFFRAVEKHIGTKSDYRIPWSRRTEYHCKRCGGHQGHVFNDGPRPTGKRWCNNGLALVFVPTEGGQTRSG